MNRTKKLYILLGSFFVVCGAAFFAIHYEEEKEQIKNSDEIILEIPSEDVTAISWSYYTDTEEEVLAFHKAEEWIYDEDEAFPTDSEKINELLETFESFGVSFVIEDVEDYGQYGLEYPTCTISLETDEETYEVLIGDFSAMDSKRYVSIGDGNVYLMSTDPMDTFEVVLSDMILHDKTPDFEQVTEVSVAGVDEYSFVYDEENDNTYCESDVYFTEINGESKPLDTTNVDYYLGNISDLELSNYAAYEVTDGDLEKYGLDEPDITLTVNYTVTEETEESEETVENEFVMAIGSDPTEREAAETSEDSERTAAYLRIGESNIIYTINSDQYKELTAATYDNLRHQEIFSAELKDIKKMEVSLGGEEYTITLGKDGDDLICKYNEEEFSIDGIELAFDNLKAERFTEEEADGKEEISLIIYLDNEKYPKVEITFYQYDGELCLAEVDGETVSLVARDAVVDLIEAVNAIVL